MHYQVDDAISADQALAEALAIGHYALVKAKRFAGALAGSLTLALLLSGTSYAAVATFSIGRSSGPPGTLVTMRSVTPCTLPTGTAAQATVYITLSRNATVLTNAYVDPNSSGAWSAGLTVPLDVPPGNEVVSAFCVAKGHEIGPEDASATRNFVVTQSDLARTGSESLILGLCGTSVLVAGCALMLAVRRRGPIGST